MNVQSKRLNVNGTGKNTETMLIEFQGEAVPKKGMLALVIL